MESIKEYVKYVIGKTFSNAVFFCIFVEKFQLCILSNFITTYFSPW